MSTDVQCSYDDRACTVESTDPDYYEKSAEIILSTLQVHKNLIIDIYKYFISD